MGDNANEDALALFANNNENNVVESEEGDVLASLPAPTGTAAPLKVNALSKTKKSKKPLTAEQKASRKATLNATKASQAYKNKQAKKKTGELARQERYGILLYGKNSGKQATPLEVLRIDDLWTKLIAETPVTNEAPTLKDAIAAYKDDLEAKPKRVKLTSAEKENRATIRKTLRGFNIKPSAARVTAYTKKRANFKNFKPNNATAKKTLMNYFLAEKAYSPELKGLRLQKASEKEKLEGAKLKAQADLLTIAPERTVKGKVVKTTNPATVKHLAELRLAGYKIAPSEIVELSSLIKKNKLAELAAHPVMKRLVADGKKMKNACHRCLLTTIFGQAME